MRGRDALLVAVGGGILALAPISAADDGALYEWTDESGVVRYTPHRDRVPRSARASMKVVTRGEPAPQADTNGSPAVPGALPAVMGSKLPGEIIGSPQDLPKDPGALARRIAELREAIARDEASLRALVADGQGSGTQADPRLEAIANRLPVMKTELQRLEQHQREMGGPPGTQKP